jgi:FkbM family methyltransferase
MGSKGAVSYMANEGTYQARFSAHLKKNIRGATRRLGVDLVRWRPQSSPEAALARMFATHRIDTVLDVGANEGQYARLLRELGFGGRIISFEPLTVPHGRLQLAAALDDSWTVAPRMAIGQKDGEVRMNIASNNGASSSVLNMLDAHKNAAPDVAYMGSEVVPIGRLDSVAGSFLGNAQNIFLKVDVQGYELQVLQGASGLLRRLKGIQIELSLVPLYEGQTLFSDLIDRVRGQNFDIWGIIPGLADNSTGRLLQADAIFFRA